MGRPYGEGFQKDLLDRLLKYFFGFPFVPFTLALKAFAPPLASNFLTVTPDLSVLIKSPVTPWRRPRSGMPLKAPLANDITIFVAASDSSGLTIFLKMASILPTSSADKLLRELSVPLWYCYIINV